MIRINTYLTYYPESAHLCSICAKSVIAHTHQVCRVCNWEFDEMMEENIHDGGANEVPFAYYKQKWGEAIRKNPYFGKNYGEVLKFSDSDLLEAKRISDENGGDYIYF